MNVHELMTPAPAVCTTSDHLTRAAQILWERDCGAVPVLDGAGQLAGIVTDRDICMAAYTQGRPLHEIPVADVMSKVVFTIGPDATAADALETLRLRAVRRLPVTDAAGRLVGIVSLADFARVARERIDKRQATREQLVQTLWGVSAPRPAETAAASPLGSKTLVPVAPPARKTAAKPTAKPAAKPAKRR
jgi:CBS domain-containing protein